MLTRAARRRQTVQYVRQAAEQLQLPWLCPALVQPFNRPRQSRTIASRPSLPRTKSSASQVAQSRKLASHAPVGEDFESNDDYLPFSYSSPHVAALPKTNTSLSALPHFDLNNILQIDNTTALPPERIDTNRVYGIDIRGNADEVETTLEACLQVQRWDRAFAILGQLNIIYQTKHAQLLRCYNRVLREMSLDLIYNRNMRNADKINNWVEVQMKKAGLEPDAETFAWKIKIALATMEGSKRDRTVRRYWEMAKSANFENHVASLRHILHDSDLGKLSKICPLKVDFPLEEEVVTLADLQVASEGEVLSKPSMVVRETEQKGLGLSSLRQSLSLFGENAHLENEAQRNWTEEQKKEYAVKRQIRLETDAIESAVGRWQAEHEKMAKMGISGAAATGRTGALLWQWHEILTEKIIDENRLVAESEAKEKKTAQDRSRCEYGPFLRLLPPNQLAALTTIGVVSIMNKVGVTKSVKLTRLVVEVGKMVEQECETEALRRRALARKGRTGAMPEEDIVKAGLLEPSTVESAPTRRGGHPNGQVYQRRPRWTVAIQAKVGAILCEHLLDSAKITITKEDKRTGKKLSIAQPVFIHQSLYSNGRKIGAVSVHESFVEMMVHQPAGHVIAKQLPMVCQPKPWQGFEDGGFYESALPFLRVKHAESAQSDYTQAAANRGDLDQLFAGVDVLGKTAWKVNSDVFGVMLEAWNSGEAVANLPSLNKVFPEVPRPSENADPKTRYEWFSKIRTIENEKSGLHSNRCFQNFQMEIARAYLDETFYLPHNIDFRGRAYPIPPYLNQMGADNSRGLLLFAKGRQLGEDGLTWLKIHLSNVFGYDKASLSDRSKFPMEHLEEIRDSVRNPLNGKRWWLKAEDPWQCLAACFELTKALDSPDPTKFVSRLPVHQDGSCNGLQHYAALGGDVAGARQVNLEPGDKPADVYTGVCELVKADVHVDAAKGDELAKLLDGRITRKVVKQTVMTNVYGVTFLGAIRQVRKQVDDLIPEVKEQGKSGQAATYIAKKIFVGLGKMFTGAHDIQYWLGDCANRVSQSLSPAQLQKIEEQEASKGTPVVSTGILLHRKKSPKAKTLQFVPEFRSTMIWTTPLRLPVVQPYRVNKGQRIQTNLQNITLAEPSVADSVNRRKQLQAFPPNFIHSLDATHMVLSALKADELGLTFSAVHDSFWTHAADVNSLNRLLRDAFIRMHSEDIIGRLAAEFKTRYSGHLYLAHVSRSNPVAQKIMEYRTQLAKEHKLTTTGRSASATVHERRHIELIREIRKRKLTQSEDPKEREEGQKTVTASSIYEELHGEKYLYAKDSLGETAIGSVPKIADDAVIEQALQSPDVSNDVDMEGTLEPLMESVTEAGEDDLEEPEDAGIKSKKSAPTESVEKKRTRAKKGEGSSRNHQVWLWLPLTFRDVPKKGDFDVTRLRDSQYFFS